MTALAGAAVAAGVLALAGCSGPAATNGAGGSNQAAYESGGGRAAGSAGDQKAVAPASPAKPGGNAIDSSAKVDIAPQSLIRTAELTVRVKNVQAAAARATTVAESNGGQVYADNRAGSGKDAKVDMVLKVDPERLDVVLSRLSALGKEEQRVTSTQDVTGEVADVDSRVATMKASLARVRALIARSVSIGELVTLEGELSRREADLESLQARQRALGEQTATATVTLHLFGNPDEAATPPGGSHRGFLSGLENGWNAFTATLAWLLAVLGAILPFLLIGVPVLIAFWWAGRRQRRATPAQPAAMQAPAE
jgi:hypothetical protein